MSEVNKLDTFPVKRTAVIVDFQPLGREKSSVDSRQSLKCIEIY